MTEKSQLIGKKQGHRMTAALIAVVAVIFTAGSIWYANRGTQPAGPMHEPTWDEMLAEANAGGYKLCTTEALAERCQTDPQHVLIIDARQEWEYRPSHIKGAVLFPVETGKWWWFRHKSALSRVLGPDKDLMVVFYCGGPA